MNQSLDAKILLVDDTAEICRQVEMALAGCCRVDVASSIDEGKKKLRVNKYDLIILDVVLPDGNGFEFYQKDVQGQVPVVFLTSSLSWEDKVQGFSLGAEDFVTKPFDQRELRLRIESRLKKLGRSVSRGERQLMGLIFDENAHQARLPHEAQDLALTPIEYRLLLQFCQSPDRIFSRQDLIDLCWGNQVNVLDRTVDSHLSALRKKIASAHLEIKSIRGMGYKVAKSQ